MQLTRYGRIARLNANLEMPIKVRSIFKLSYLRRLLEICGRPAHLRRTGAIALVVGSWLTLINQGDVIWAGQMNTVLLLKVLLNYLTPFVVANFGLLSSKEGRE
ncbi:MAG: hypothetical protein AVDCRST_MAG14-258 [uncultured Rubrobacteraceae bacterium]|uniref:Uncharacterized protein n=1 Tax=uncultured Rubrobacteraceae bacterium TaxID=349277 RepID=A0A6J4QHM6_9ACTN|nr:MAG: hypothetical protein AVDCRST_MAG14-258 [uncultured Rubrobacteraceae bacterium]